MIAVAHQEPGAVAPAVSGVVPCRNEARHIEDCVRSLLAQEPPPGGFEIIVADGMSEDGTRAVLDKLARSDARLRVVDNPPRLTPAGMNAGLRAARGQWIAILGAHNRYAPDYLSCAFAAAQRTGADNVGGAMFCEAEGWLPRAIGAAHHSPFAVGGARWHNPEYEGPADTVFGGFYRRDVFDRLGGFDEELVRNQDDEFNLRLTRAGGKIWQSPQIKSWYRPRNSLSALFRQYVQYGYWKVRVIQKHRLPASVRHLVPGGFVVALLALAVLSPFFQLALWCGLALAAVYLAATLGASVLVAARNGWSLFAVLPAVFACYHFGYGYGFLRGLVDFCLLRRDRRGAFTALTR